MMKTNNHDAVENPSRFSRGIKSIISHQEELSKLQRSFLIDRAATIQKMGNLVLKTSEAVLGDHKQDKAVYSKQMLEEFALGSIEKCFGGDYQTLKGTRYPRIPNSFLLCMSRIMEITATRFDFSAGSQIIAEFDILGDEWFLSPNRDGIIPLSMLMEIALQPCGFLSAYLGTILTLPGQDIYFRNLDGQATVNRVVNSIGKTLQTKANLLSSTSSGETVIQRFSFIVSCDDQVIFQGQSVFGYFSKESLKGQSGFRLISDEQWGHNSAQRAGYDCWISVHGESIRRDFGSIIPSGRARMVDEVKYVTCHQKIKKIKAIRRIYPTDWYFRCHFYEDPVMPGSLGVEAVCQALNAALYQIYSGDHPNLVILHEEGHPIVWKYRGQILPGTDLLSLEVKDFEVDTSHSEYIRVIANASIWSDKVRVYEINGIVVRIILNRGI